MHSHLRTDTLLGGPGLAWPVGDLCEEGGVPPFVEGCWVVFLKPCPMCFPLPPALPSSLQVLEYINKRQAELESERKELTEYQSLDKQRRGLEFALCDHDLSKVKDALLQVKCVLRGGH